MIFYTDGAYSQSRNKGGFSFIEYCDNKPKRKYYKSIVNATNQQAEMLAVMSVFKYILKNHQDKNHIIITDSMYVIGTSTLNYKINCNKELWQRYFKLYKPLKNKITFQHVPGHKGIEGNEICDILAVIASESITL